MTTLARRVPMPPVPSQDPPLRLSSFVLLAGRNPVDGGTVAFVSCAECGDEEPLSALPEALRYAFRHRCAQ